MNAPIRLERERTPCTKGKNIPDFNVSWSGPLKATLHPVRNWLQRSGHKGASRIFAFVPEVLEENAPCYALKGNTKQYYLIFEIPAGSKPGIFTGKLTVTGKGIPARDIPVEFKVLPFQLPRIDNRQYAAMYHADFYRPFLRPGSDSGLDRARLLDMRRQMALSIRLTAPSTSSSSASRLAIYSPLA